MPDDAASERDALKVLGLLLTDNNAVTRLESAEPKSYPAILKELLGSDLSAEQVSAIGAKLAPLAKAIGSIDGIHRSAIQRVVENAGKPNQGKTGGQ